MDGRRGPAHSVWLFPAFATFLPSWIAGPPNGQMYCSLCLLPPPFLVDPHNKANSERPP